MEVMPGYIPIEVGVFPSDWPLLALKQISPKQGVGLVINPSTYFNKAGTVPLLVGSNVSENAIDARRANRITELSNELLSASRLSTGDLVTVRVGAPGVTAVVPPDLDGANCASMMIVRRHSSFNSHWLCAAMNSRLGRGQVEHVQYGTAQKQFNISDAVNFKFPVPPRPEQDAIASVASDIDALLGALDRLIAKKRDLKQAAMQQLLTGQTRLPGFDGEWEVKLLGQICEIGMGRTPPRLSSVFWGKGYTWLSIADLKDKVVSESKEQITALAAASMTIVPKGTLLMSFKLSIGRLCFAGQDLFTNEAICSFNKLQANSQYLYYYLMTVDFSLYGKQAVKGYTLNKESLKQIEIRLPKLSEQTAIAAVLFDIDAELDALEGRRAKTSTLKQGMMQELLTGRMRLV